MNGKNWMRNYLKGKHPKTLLEVFSEDDDMPHKGKGKNYTSTPGHPKPIKPKKGRKK